MLRTALQCVVITGRVAALIGRASLVLLLTVTLPRIAGADVVTDWNAVIADLVAGVYTVVVRGVNNTTGTALVEIYEVP